MTEGAAQKDTTSPGGTYTVRFTEDIESKQGLMFENRVIWFSLIKKGTVIMDKELFARDKAYKLPSFIEKYPHQEWKAENILRLGNIPPLPDTMCNEVIVANLTSNAIGYVDVITFQPERFIIFDLQPNSTVKLYSQPENASSLTFLAGGKFSGGQIMNRIQVDFQLPESQSSVARFCITISNQGISITSSEYEGVIYDTTELWEALRKTTPENFSPDSLPKPIEVRVPKSNCEVR
jgi:hypothetical protein